MPRSEEPWSEDGSKDWARGWEIEICVMAGEEAFISAVRNAGDLESIKEIEKALQPEIDDYYRDGDGVYLIRPEWFPGQAADYRETGHQWEISPGWGASSQDVHFLGEIGDLAGQEQARCVLSRSALAERALGELRRLEFGVNFECPSCGGHEDNYHRDKCELRAILKGLEGGVLAPHSTVEKMIYLDGSGGEAGGLAAAEALIAEWLERKAAALRDKAGITYADGPAGELLAQAGALREAALAVRQGQARREGGA